MGASSRWAPEQTDEQTERSPVSVKGFIPGSKNFLTAARSSGRGTEIASASKVSRKPDKAAFLRFWQSADIRVGKIYFNPQGQEV